MMRNWLIFIMLVLGLHLSLNLGSVAAILNGYEDYFTALVLSAIVAPLIAPLFD